MDRARHASPYDAPPVPPRLLRPRARPVRTPPPVRTADDVEREDPVFLASQTLDPFEAADEDAGTPPARPPRRPSPRSVTPVSLADVPEAPPVRVVEVEPPSVGRDDWMLVALGAGMACMSLAVVLFVMS